MMWYCPVFMTIIFQCLHTSRNPNFLRDCLFFFLFPRKFCLDRWAPSTQIKITGKSTFYMTLEACNHRTVTAVHFSLLEVHDLAQGLFPSIPLAWIYPFGPFYGTNFFLGLFWKPQENLKCPSFFGSSSQSKPDILSYHPIISSQVIFSFFFLTERKLKSCFN